MPLLPRHFDRELDPGGGAGDGDGVFQVLLGGEDFREEGGKLHLPEDPAGLDVAEDLFQVPDPGRQRLHLAEALVNLFQLAADRLKGLADPALEGGLELLVDRAADFFEALAGVRLHLPEGPAHLLRLGPEGVGGGGLGGVELPLHRLQAGLLGGGGGVLVLGDEAAEGLGGAGGLSGRGVGEGALHPGKGLVQQLLKVVRRIPPGAPGGPQRHQGGPETGCREDDRKEDEGEDQVFHRLFVHPVETEALKQLGHPGGELQRVAAVFGDAGDFLPGGFKAGFRLGAVFP